MMQNGNRIRVIRILASLAIALTALTGGAYLIRCGNQLPDAWWYLSCLAVAGVVGADAVAAFLTKGGEK
jgi:hypothetical protein